MNGGTNGGSMVVGAIPTVISGGVGGISKGGERASGFSISIILVSGCVYRGGYRGSWGRRTYEARGGCGP